VPRHCLTQGLGTILRARHLLLFAFGAHRIGRRGALALGLCAGHDQRAG